MRLYNNYKGLVFLTLAVSFFICLLFFIDQGSNIKLGTFLLPFFLYLLYTIIKGYYKFLPDIKVVEKLFILSIIYRVLFLIIILHLSELGIIKPFAVFDDETYSFIADEGIPIKTNLYQSILIYLYNFFGKNTLVGRFTNLFISSISLYPISSILSKIIKIERARKIVLLLFAFLPYEALWSIFEVKEVLLGFVLIIYLDFSLKVIYYEYKKRNIQYFVLNLLIILFLSIIANGIRSGMFYIMIISLIASLLAKKKKFVVAIIIFLLALVIFYLTNINEDDLNKYYLYKKWIRTQLSEASIYNWFLITEYADIWKLPITFIAYCISPIPTPRKIILGQPFFISIGTILKLFSIPFILFGMFKIYKLAKKISYLIIVFIIPVIFISIWNFTNHRQGQAYIFIYFISFGLFLEDILKARKKVIG